MQIFRFRIWKVIFVSWTALTACSYAQSANALININPFPSAYINDWELIPNAVGNLTVINNSGTSFSARLRVNVTQSGKGLILTSLTDLITIGNSPTTVIDNTKIIRFGDASFPNKDFKNKMLQSGRLPQGEYSICIRVEGKNNNIIVNYECANFTILYPEPPHLVYPSSGMELENMTQYPVFQWVPVNVPPNYRIRYILKIVEMLPGQIPVQALKANMPHYINENLTVSNVQYPTDALPLDTGKTYVWQVQVLDQYGMAPTQNDGKSEIFTFKMKPTKAIPIQNQVVLNSPGDAEIIKSKTPFFSWSFVQPAGKIVSYNLRVVKVENNQSLETAIKNYPVLNQNTSTHSYQPSTPMTLNGSDKYAWQVSVILAKSKDTLQRSEIRTFTLYPLVLLLPTDNSIVNTKRPEFQWAYQGSSGLYYDIKIIKKPSIMPLNSAMQDMMDNAQNPVYVKYNINGSQLSSVHDPNLEIPLFQPDSDIPIDQSSPYLWQVSAKKQPYGDIIAESEIRQFAFNPYQSGFASNCDVKGKLYYEFAGSGEYMTWPMKNINVKFVVKYILKYNSHTGDYYDSYSAGPQGEIEIPVASLPQQYQSDCNKTVAIGTTDDNCNFSFSFMNSMPMGIINNNFTFSAGNEFGYTYKGPLYRVIRMIVDSPFYTSPETDILLQPGESKNYSQMIAHVRSYSLTVTVNSPGSWSQGQILAANSPIGKMIVYMLRRNRPAEVPANEGSPSPTIPNESPFKNSIQSGYQVIAKTITDQSGKATFSRLVISAYAQNDEYFIYSIADSTQTSINYVTLIPVSYYFKNAGDNAVYNTQYQYPFVSTQFAALPLKPVVKGIIKRSDSGQPMDGAQVKLLDSAGFIWIDEACLVTSGDGVFKFNNLNNSNPAGPIRGLKVLKYGFRDTVLSVKSGTVLKPGDSWSSEILMQPDSKVTGNLVDENGNGISAQVTVIGGESQAAYAPMVKYMNGEKSPPALFELDAPGGYNKIVIDPTMSGDFYLKDTISVFISGSAYNMGTVVVKKAYHRIKIFIGDLSKAQGEFYYITSKLANADVKLTTVGGTLIKEQSTDASGNVEFLFANTEKNYMVTVTGPANQNFETKQVQFQNNESKDWINYQVFLKPAAQIHGYVYVGTNKQPVPNAHVQLKASSGTITTETYADAKGYYILHDVPIGKNTFMASKKSSNFIGDQREINVQIIEKENVNFNLKIYSEMDITHLMSFPIEVDSLAEKNGVITITGEFVSLDSLKNNLFQAKQSKLSFSDIGIVPDPKLTAIINGKTVPVARPKILPMITDNNLLNLTVFNSYSGCISNKKGVQLNGRPDGSAVIKGKVLLSKSSFTIPSTELDFKEDGFYLTAANVKDLQLPVITADMSDPLTTNNFLIIDSTGHSINYSLYGYKSFADSSKSILYKDSLILNTTIHTNIAGMTPADLKLSIGNVKITTNSVYAIINSTKKINFALGSWNLEIDKWSFDGYLTASLGTLKTNVVNIPLTGITIKPTEIDNPTLNLKSMDIGGVAPLNISGQVLFGYENQSNKWFLTVAKGNQNYAASLSGLPGMDPKDSIYISSFSLYSDGTKNFSPVNKTISIYKIGVLSLDQIIAGNNSIEMSSLSFNIPKLGQIGGIIQYYKENNNIKLKLVPIQIKISTSGVDLSFGNDAKTYPEYFDENGLRVRGTVSEQNKFSLISWLYYTKDSTSIWVETPNSSLTTSKSWQKMSIGGANTYLNNVTGNMKVQAGNWNNFTFTGNLIVPSGIDPNRNQVTFTVYGDIVANNQQIGVTNVKSPFGGISLTYEPENKRFVGSMSMENDLGTAYIKGQADVVVDSEGWYFFAGGELHLYNPDSRGLSGILLGHHSISNEMRNTFAQYSYIYQHKGSLPMTFPTIIDGFYFEGMTSIPVQYIIDLPNIDIDLVVVKAKLWVNIGADIRMSLNLSNGLTIGAGMDYFVDAGFSISEWALIECGGVSFETIIEYGSDGQFSSNGDWSVELTGDLTLSGSAYAGWGICSSHCHGKFCHNSSWSGGKVFGIKGHVGSDKKYINFYLK